MCGAVQGLKGFYVLPGSQHVIALGEPCCWISILPGVTYLLPKLERKVEEKIKDRKNEKSKWGGGCVAKHVWSKLDLGKIPEETFHPKKP